MWIYKNSHFQNFWLILEMAFSTSDFLKKYLKYLKLCLYEAKDKSSSVEGNSMWQIGYKLELVTS